jgi:hypothetical protein
MLLLLLLLLLRLAILQAAVGTRVSTHMQQCSSGTPFSFMHAQGATMHDNHNTESSKQ